MIDPTDNDPIDFTFADDGDLRRKAPRDKPEDPVEARLAREVEAAPFIAEALERRVCAYTPGVCGIEVRHGSGKVRV